MPRTGTTRYRAEWVEKEAWQTGSRNLDLDEYGKSFHPTKQAAEKAAVLCGRTAARCSWIAVAEETYRGGRWIECRRWMGDFEGLGPEAI